MNNPETKLTEADRCELQRLEEELWQENTRFDRLRMETTFANDFFEFGRSGKVYSRETLLSHQPQPIEATLPLENLSIRLLAESVAQVTYNSHVTYHGVTEHGRRSSIWCRDRNSWQLRFHQGTPFDGSDS